MQPRALNAVHALGRIESLDAIGKPLKKAVDRVIRPGTFKDLLAGTWFGHPMHPVLTDIPIGAWTSSWILDLLGGEESERAADVLLAIGVASALPTAVTGLTDWTDTWGKTRRVGVVHAMGNVTALGFFAASLAARARGRRRAGVALSTIGSAVASAAAYLGGHLSFGKGVGVDNTAFQEEPTEWTTVLQTDALSVGKAVSATAGGAPVLVYGHSDGVFAISDTCSHRGCSLAEGTIHDDTVECPCHGSVFRLSDGGIVRGPATSPQPAYDVRVEDGRVQVRIKDPKN